MASPEHVRLPEGVGLVRTTPEFTPDTVPAGLRAAHRVADGVWGLLRVRAGTVVFVVEGTGDHGESHDREARRALVAGEEQVIEPGVLHHVEPDSEARFVIEFHR